MIIAYGENREKWAQEQSAMWAYIAPITMLVTCLMVTIELQIFHYTKLNF